MCNVLTALRGPAASWSPATSHLGSVCESGLVGLGDDASSRSKKGRKSVRGDVLLLSLKPPLVQGCEGGS